MQAYLVRRLALLPALLLGISLISFILLNLAPGDPAYVLLKLEAPDLEPSPEAVRALHHELGLDDPSVIRYGRWLFRTVQGDLGTSWRNGKPIMNELWQRLPATMILTWTSLALAVSISVPLGIISALWSADRCWTGSAGCWPWWAPRCLATCWPCC